MWYFSSAGSEETSSAETVEGQCMASFLLDNGEIARAPVAFTWHDIHYFVRPNKKHFKFVLQGISGAAVKDERRHPVMSKCHGFKFGDALFPDRVYDALKGFSNFLPFKELFLKQKCGSTFHPSLYILMAVATALPCMFKWSWLSLRRLFVNCECFRVYVQSNCWQHFHWSCSRRTFLTYCMKLQGGVEMLKQCF